MNLVDLEVFVAVARACGLDQASETLGLPQEAVEARLARLEHALGCALLQESSTGLVPTEQGEVLLARCAPALAEIAAAAGNLSVPEQVSGTLRITTARDLGVTRPFSRLLSAFRQSHPDVRLDVVLTNRNVDLSAERFDVAIRAHGPALPSEPGLMLRTMGTLSRGLFASPGYLRGSPPIEEPEDLSAHRCVSHSISRGIGWNLVREGGEERSLPNLDFEVVVNDFGLLLELLAADGGIGDVPTFFADPLVERGALVPILPPWQLPGGWISLLWPAQSQLPRRTRLFIDLVAEQFKGVSPYRISSGPIRVP